MKKLAVIGGLLLSLVISPMVRAGEFEVKTESDSRFKIWCRHDAIYWGSVVGEAHTIRMMLGWYENNMYKGWHVQPQIKLKNEWWYFKCKEVWDAKLKHPTLQLILISMPKAEGDVWRPGYSMTFAEFCLLHNSWILSKKGKAYNTYKQWNKAMNELITDLKELEESLR